MSLDNIRFEDSKSLHLTIPPQVNLHLNGAVMSIDIVTTDKKTTWYIDGQEVFVEE